MKHFIFAFTLIVGGSAFADTFSNNDVARWQKEFDETAKYGRSVFDNSSKVQISNNKVACAQCHPNATNIHPETYPKFQKQIGRVAALWEMINWCIRNPLENKKGLAADSQEMIALQAYITSERKGVKLAPGKH